MKQLYDATKLIPQTKKTPKVHQIDIIKGVYHVLSEDLGKPTAIKLILKIFLWDMMLNRPHWEPNRFTFKDESEEIDYKKKYEELIFVIILFEKLKVKYGREKAIELTAKCAVPPSVINLDASFKSIPDMADIDQFRQQMADFLGDGNGSDWTEKVSSDKTEVHYKFTQCAYVEILRAYGLSSAAASICYCDHIFFDNAMPELYFKRDHCIGIGDIFCDHVFRIRTPDDANENILRYGDTEKADFDAKGLIEKWTKNYKANGGCFQW